jgi:hypothetical protein
MNMLYEDRRLYHNFQYLYKYFFDELIEINFQQLLQSCLVFVKYRAQYLAVVVSIDLYCLKFVRPSEYKPIAIKVMRLPHICIF